MQPPGHFHRLMKIMNPFEKAFQNSNGCGCWRPKHLRALALGGALLSPMNVPVQLPAEETPRQYGVGAFGGEAVDSGKLRDELFSRMDGNQRVPVATREQWEKKRQEIRRRIFELIGPLPEKRGPLNPKVLSEDSYHGLTRRLVQYEVEPGDVVKAWLLIPKEAKGRLPAIICRHQTVDAGKDEPIGLHVFTGVVEGKPRYRTVAEGEADGEGAFYALKHALKGYVTLSFDEVSVGEHFPSPKGPFFTDAFYEHNPQWESFAAKSVFDGMRAVDYLQGLESVDPERIGITGHSLGGFTAAWQMALDERLKVGVQSCGYQLWQANYSEQGALGFSRKEWFVYIPSLRTHLENRRLPFDYHELLALVAPRVFLDTGSNVDSINRQSDQNTLLVDLLKGVYAFYFPPEQLAVTETKLAYPGQEAQGPLYPLRLLACEDRPLYGRQWNFAGHGYTKLQFFAGLKIFDQAFGVNRNDEPK